MKRKLNNINKILIIFLVLFFLVGCEQPHKIRVHKAHVYKTRFSELSAAYTDNDDDVYLYIMMSTDNERTVTYYSATSLQPVSDFRSLSWTSDIKPPVDLEELASEEIASVEIPMTYLPAAMEEEISQDETSVSQENNTPNEEASTEESETSSAGDSSDDSGGDGGGMVIKFKNYGKF